MRVVLDTNVLISDIFFRGPPARILQAWRDQKISLVISPEILDEWGGRLAPPGTTYCALPTDNRE